LGGAVISRVLTLLSFIFVARIIGKESFGELGMIQSTVVMFQTISGFGLGITATKYVAELREVSKDRVGRIIPLTELISLVTGGAVALGTFILAPWIAKGIISAPHLVTPLRIGSVILFFGALFGSQNGALLGFEAFRAIARVNIITGVISVPLVIGGVLWLGVSGALIGLAAGMCLSWIISHRAVVTEGRKLNIIIRWNGCFSEWKSVLGFSIPAVLSAMLVTPVTWLCNVILVNQPAGYAEMGVFNAANQWRSAMLFFPYTLGAVALPMLANLRGEKLHRQYREVLKVNIVFNTGIALGGAILVSLFSPLIMQGYGKGYENGTGTLVLLSFSVVLVAFNNVIGQAIMSQGRMWYGFFFNFLWGGVLLSSAYLLIPRMGSKGLAWAFVLSYLMHSIWQTMFMKRTIKAVPSFQ